MTSKNLYIRRMKKDFEQRIWLPVVFLILTFLVLELPLISRFEYLRERTNFLQKANDYLMNDFFTPNMGFTYLTMGVAFISALSGFAYMHSAKKLDVYHSIPVKREKLFWEQYSYGILYYLVPTLLHVIICMVICMANGVASGNIWGQAVGFIWVQLLVYLATYSLAVMTVCLTGNIVISVLGIAVLFCYSSILLLLKSSMMDEFYMTYYGSEADSGIWTFTPLHLLIKMIDEMTRSDALAYTEYIGFYVKFIFMIAIFTVAALYLYKKRPTEVAGKSIAFPITEPVIKTMVVFPVSIAAGFLFRSIVGNYDSIGWFLVGCLFGFVIIGPVMEIIFRKDVKAVLSHPLQLVFNGVCVLCVIAIFHFDLLGYDSYVPAEEKVESYAVNMSQFRTINNGYSSIENRLDSMKITGNESVRKLVEHAASITRSARKDIIQSYDQKTTMYSEFTVKYNLKGGKEVYRSYLINYADEQVMQWIGDMYADEEFKSGAYPVLNEEHEKNYIGVLLEYAFGSQELPLPQDKMDKFVAAYQKELQALTLDEIRAEYPVARLSFAVGFPEEEVNAGERVYVTSATTEKAYYESDFEYYGEEYGYYIYPSFTESIALLEEYGAVLENELAIEDVIAVQVEDSRLEVNDDDGMWDKVAYLEYSKENGDDDIIADILANIQMSNMRGDFSANKLENNINVSMRYLVDGIERYDSAYFHAGMVPETVRADIEEALKKIQE